MASALGNWDITLNEDMYIEKSCKICVLILIRDRCLNYNITCLHVSLDYCGSYIGYRVQDKYGGKWGRWEVMTDTAYGSRWAIMAWGSEKLVRSRWVQARCWI